MATILGRGVMTSRTTLSPNSTTDWISLRSSSSMRPSSVPAEISASMFSAWVGGSSSPGIVGDLDQRLEEGEHRDERFGEPGPRRG
jgi:hypothetical protein